MTVTSGMGVPPMSATGVSPVDGRLTAGTAVARTGKMPVPRCKA